MTSSLPRTIIGVPGMWPTRSDIVSSIAKSSGGYLLAGAIMMHIETKTIFQVDVYDYDENLVEAFRLAGGGKIVAEDLKRIADHTFCVYLIAEGGSVESARRTVAAGEALLKSGGLGVKIESAGLAHSAATWGQFAAEDLLGNLLKAFVTFIGDGEVYYSCGMHNLGYPDCLIEASISPTDAANLLHTFLGYLLIENPNLTSGETFSIDAESPYYRMSKDLCSMFTPDDPFHNPYGIWKLQVA